MSTLGYRKKVCYFYDRINHFFAFILLFFRMLTADCGNFNYGHGHPMKPLRIRMTHNLLLNYGLYKQLRRPWRASALQLSLFHSEDYVKFLREISSDTIPIYSPNFAKYHIGEDCPVFNGLYDFCQVAAGGSIAAALRLNAGADVAINWAGGLHHAKRSSASGFCYINDIVLAILELLRVHERVLYIDIDIHHGDGVEEAFYTSSRVLTLSLHKYGDFFPGTGEFKDMGKDEGLYYATNLPLRDGMTDDAYIFLFKPILKAIMDWYRPGAIVMQCGADSLAGDRLGNFNLSLQGHGSCVEYAKSFGVPLLLVGGGGYTTRNVSRCWCNETAIAVGTSLPELLPYNDYLEYYSPDFNLSVPTSPKMENRNTRAYLENLLCATLNNLKNIQGRPVPVDKVQFSQEGQLYKFGILSDDFNTLETIDKRERAELFSKIKSEASDTRRREEDRDTEKRLMDAMEEHEKEKAEAESERNDVRISAKEAASMVERDNSCYEKNEKTMSKLSSDKGPDQQEEKLYEQDMKSLQAH